MKRLDQLMVTQGMVASRALAQKLIRENAVEVNHSGLWQLANKPSVKLAEDQSIRIKPGSLPKYVSRAGEKLERALKLLSLDLTGLIALDVGQSTGGFSDCLLQSGIKQVVGVDVGHDQLSPQLKDASRLVCLEGINARELNEAHFTELNISQFDLCVMDVSFISQTLIIPQISSLIKTNSYFISLVKPQFEVGKEGIGKKGIVRDESLYPMVKDKISKCLQSSGFELQDYFESPILGGDGNKEYLAISIRT